KIGEYWAMGLPVVTTPNVSDTDEIIRRERVGVVVRENSDDAYRSAARELKALLEDEELAARCRRAAEDHYSLDRACDRQFDLYRDLTRDDNGRVRGKIQPQSSRALGTKTNRQEVEGQLETEVRS
ncbi:MAG TPA: glycosyltransferase, partial [Blastocatellia bacterium]|nr:glycosyltransferase [Blastocatellia bacterium]